MDSFALVNHVRFAKLYSYTVLGVICGGEIGTNGCHLAIISVDVTFAHHFVAPHHPTL